MISNSFMKLRQTIPALLALIALLLPCAHAAHHHHDECAPEAVCAAAQCACHVCEEVSCSGKPEIPPLNSISPVEPPVRQLLVITTVSTDGLAVPPAVPSAGILLLLRTVQLLI